MSNSISYVLSPLFHSTPKLTLLQQEPFIKQSLHLKLDSDSSLCPTFIKTGSCPLGANCPLRHLPPSPLNFQPPPPIPTTAHGRTVCKHWLRGLCKKGASCEFMHEYNLRKMPECWFFAKYGFCSNGDECMYLHVTEQMRKRECKDYKMGFCANGENCEAKHVRKFVCEDYLVGFCRKGPECEKGHPRFDPEPDPPLSSTRIPDVGGARFLPEASFRLYRPDWLAFAADISWAPFSLSFSTTFSLSFFTDYLTFPLQTGPNNQGGGGGEQRERTQWVDRSGAGQNNNRSRDNNNNSGGGGGGGDGGGGRRNLAEVLCYKCSQYGHFANQFVPLFPTPSSRSSYWRFSFLRTNSCTNPAVPGNRGGLNNRDQNNQGGGGGQGGGNRGGGGQQQQGQSGYW